MASSSEQRMEDAHAGLGASVSHPHALKWRGVLRDCWSYWCWKISRSHGENIWEVGMFKRCEIEVCYFIITKGCLLLVGKCSEWQDETSVYIYIWDDLHKKFDMNFLPLAYCDAKKNVFLI